MKSINIIDVRAKELFLSSENLNRAFDKFAPNSVILARTNPENKITTVINFGELKDTKQETLLVEVLKYLAADTRLSNNFNDEFKDISAVSNKPLFASYLSGSQIFRTDANGKVNKALELKDGLKLKDTALKIKKTHSILLCDKKNLKAVIYNHAKAIGAQMVYKTALIKEVDEISKAISKDKKEIATPEIIAESEVANVG